jgi:hypothetical protein
MPVGTQVEAVHRSRRVGATLPELDLVTSARSGRSRCRDQVRSRARVLAFMKHDRRGGCTASRPIRRETASPRIADRVQFQPTAGFNVSDIAPD